MLLSERNLFLLIFVFSEIRHSCQKTKATMIPRAKNKNEQLFEMITDEKVYKNWIPSRFSDGLFIYFNLHVFKSLFF